MLYHYFFVTVALIAFIWRGSSLIKSIKEKNRSRTKSELFFLSLMLLVVIAIIVIERHYLDK